MIPIPVRCQTQSEYSLQLLIAERPNVSAEEQKWRIHGSFWHISIFGWNRVPFGCSSPRYRCSLPFSLNVSRDVFVLCGFALWARLISTSQTRWGKQSSDSRIPRDYKGVMVLRMWIHQEKDVFCVNKKCIKIEQPASTSSFNDLSTCCLVPTSKIVIKEQFMVCTYVNNLRSTTIE